MKHWEVEYLLLRMEELGRCHSLHMDGVSLGVGGYVEIHS